MCSIEEQIPLFPSSFVPENRDAIDFNSNDIIAVGCGSSVNFSYVKNFQLKQAYSISIGTSYVTALRFHPSNELLIIGDSKGYLYIYDYSRRFFACQPFLFEENHSISQILFSDFGLLVLNKKCAFGYLEILTKSSKYQFSFIWKTLLPEKTTNFCIDPFRKSRIFVYGRNTNFFQHFLLDKAKKSIKPITEQLFLMNNLVFQDAQFSIHIQNYIFFVTEQSVMLYNVEHNIVITIPHFQKTSSFLDRFVQFPTDDSKILCFHKSGAITIFEVKEPFNLFSIAEIPFLQQEQQLFMYCLSPIRDDYLACVYSPLGLTLFDLSTFKMVSIIPFWCDQTKTLATNGMNYAIGTSNGFIIYGNLYKPEEKAVFRISKKPVTFLSIVPDKHLIYWANDGEIGEIDTGFRKLTRFPEHCLSTQKAVGTIDGGFMVQREKSVLGLFIDGKEFCIPVNSSIVDFCFNDEGSNMSSGSVMIILENGLIVFLDYSKVHGVNKQIMKRSVSFSVFFVSCCAWRGNNFAVGFKDGSVLTMKIDSIEFERYDIRDIPIIKVQYCEEDLFALSEDGNLYVIGKRGDVVHCSNMIRNFFIVSSAVFAVIKFDFSVVFAKRAGFESLASSSKALPLPDKGAQLSEFLFSNPVLAETNHIIAAAEEEEEENEFARNAQFDKIHSMSSMVTIAMRMGITTQKAQTPKARSGRRAARKFQTMGTGASYSGSKLVQGNSQEEEEEQEFTEQGQYKANSELDSDENMISQNKDSISQNKDSISQNSSGNVSDDKHVFIDVHQNENEAGSSLANEEASDEKLSLAESAASLSSSGQEVSGSNPTFSEATSDSNSNSGSVLDLLNSGSPIITSSSPSLHAHFYGAYVPRVFCPRDVNRPSFDRLIPYMSKEGRDFWLHVLDRSSLRLKNICAHGDSSRYENALASILSLLDYSPSLQPIVFDAFLFARRLEEADKLLSKESPKSSTFMTNSVIAAAMISFDEEMTDEQVARIKSAGIELIMNNKRKEGGKLLRIAKLDSVAASYLIQAGHPIEAMRFIRGLSSEEEKRRDCFEVAIKYVEKSRFAEAMLLFLTSKEFHPALFCLVKLRLIVDAYVVKAFLVKKKLMVELKGQKALSIPNLIPLKKLCQTIDAQFSSLLARNNVDVQRFKLSVKPRTLSTY